LPIASSGRGDTTPIDALMNEVHEKMVADTIARNPNHAGRMYEVNINAAPEQFLDWDKPLFKQGPEVTDRLRSVMGPIPQDTILSSPWNTTVPSALKNPDTLNPAFWSTPQKDYVSRGLKTEVMMRGRHPRDQVPRPGIARSSRFRQRAAFIGTGGNAGSGMGHKQTSQCSRSVKNVSGRNRAA
jgi:hypothetical protein